MIHVAVYIVGLSASLLGLVAISASLVGGQADRWCRVCGRGQAVDYTGLCEPCREKD